MRSELQEEVIDILKERTKAYGEFSCSFTGIRRILKNVHQQKLTNALDNLLDTGFITKDKEGEYSLTNDFLEHKFQPKTGFVPLTNEIKTILGHFSRKIAIPRILLNLQGKYFGNFRYVGSGFKNDKAVIEWISINRNAQIILKLGEDSLIISCFGQVSESDINKIKTIVGSAIINENSLIQFNDKKVSLELSN